MLFKFGVRIKARPLSETVYDLIRIAYQIRDDISDNEKDGSEEILDLLEDNSRMEPAHNGLIKEYLLDAEENLKTIEPSEPRDLLLEMNSLVEPH